MKKIIYLFLTFLLLFLSVFNQSYIVNATTEENTITVKGYSNVIDDLLNFDIDLTTIDYSDDVSFIHFTQVYNETNQLQNFIYFSVSESTTKISKVNLSTSLKKEGTTFEENNHFYTLTLISSNSNEKLRKYEINSLTNNQNDETRRYALTSVLYQKEGQSTDEVKTIAIEYYFHGKSNETLEGYNQYLETITITEKEIFVYCYGEKNDSLLFNLFGKYASSYKRNSTYADAWYLFFNTDKEIDKLLEIEIDYGSFEYCLPVTTNNDQTDDLITLSKANDLVNNPPLSHQNYKSKLYVNENENQQVTITPGTTLIESSNPGWFGKYEYHYEEIDKIIDLRDYRSSSDFVFDEQATKYTFGVNFLNTERKIEDAILSMDNVPWLVKGISTNNICILRLKFITNGKLYHLGVVDVPKDPTGGISIDPSKGDFSFLKILGIVMIIVLFFVFIFPLIKEFVKLLKNLGKKNAN